MTSLTILQISGKRTFRFKNAATATSLAAFITAGNVPPASPARRAGETGGTLPAVMNAANEIAVAAFLDRKVRFPEIWRIVEEVMDRHMPVAHPDLDAILGADQWARTQAQGRLQSAKR